MEDQENINNLNKRIKDLEEELNQVKRAKKKVPLGGFFSKAFMLVISGRRLYKKSIKFWDSWSEYFKTGREATWPEQASREFAASLLNRILRIGVFGVLIALLPYIFIGLQTYITVRQNNLIELQNKLIKSQNQLAEASRRASMNYELTGILDKLDLEVRGKNNLRGIKPSSMLSARISALTRSLKPYKYLMNEDSLSKHLISPEKSQLLTTLLLIGIDMEKIIPYADFSYCDLRNSLLSKSNLNGINLENSLLDGLKSQKLTSFNFASLNKSSLQNLELTECYFRNANLDESQINYSFFKMCSFTESSFKSSEIFTSFFEKSNFSKANFSKAVITNTKFKDCDLSGAILAGCKLTNVEFTNVNFKNVKISADTFGRKVIFKNCQNLANKIETHFTPEEHHKSNIRVLGALY